MTRLLTFLKALIGGERRFTFLLVFLLFYFFLGPVFAKAEHGPSIGDVIFTAVLIAAVYSAGEKRRVLAMAVAILVEAALSFLGLGIQPPTPSWGLLVSEGRNYLFFQPFLITIPGLAIFVLVIAINMMGDGIRDITAPEGRN